MLKMNYNNNSKNRKYERRITGYRAVIFNFVRFANKRGNT